MLMPIAALLFVAPAAAETLADRLRFGDHLGSLRLDGPEPCIGNELQVLTADAVYSVDEKWTLVVCEPRTGAVRSRTLVVFPEGDPSSLATAHALAVSPAQDRVALVWGAAMATDERIRVGVWDLGAPAPRWVATLRQDGRSGDATSLAFLDGGATLLTGSADGTAPLRTFAADTGVLRVHVVDVALGPNAGSVHDTNRDEPQLRLRPPVVDGRIVASGNVRKDCASCVEETLPERLVTLADGTKTSVAAPTGGATAWPDGTTLALRDGALRLSHGGQETSLPWVAAGLWSEYAGERWLPVSEGHRVVAPTGSDELESQRAPRLVVHPEDDELGPAPLVVDPEGWDRPAPDPGPIGQRLLWSFKVTNI